MRSRGVELSGGKYSKEPTSERFRGFFVGFCEFSPFSARRARDQNLTICPILNHSSWREKLLLIPYRPTSHSPPRPMVTSVIRLERISSESRVWELPIGTSLNAEKRAIPECVTIQITIRMRGRMPA